MQAAAISGYAFAYARGVAIQKDIFHQYITSDHFDPAACAVGVVIGDFGICDGYFAISGQYAATRTSAIVSCVPADRRIINNQCATIVEDATATLIRTGPDSVITVIVDP